MKTVKTVINGTGSGKLRITGEGASKFRISPGGGGGGGGWTWDPTSVGVSSGITLTFGNLTATDTTYGEGQYNQSVIGTAIITPGDKKLFTVKVDSATTHMMIGFAWDAFTAGDSLNTIGIQSPSVGVSCIGDVWVNGSIVDSDQPFLLIFDVVDIATSGDAGGSWWYRVNGGSWSNGGNPAIGTGGYSLAGDISIYRPAATPNFNGGPGAWTILGTPGGDVPSGFTFVG